MLKSYRSTIRNLKAVRLTNILAICIGLCLTAAAYALPVETTSPATPADRQHEPVSTGLDQQCIIDYTGMAYSGGTDGSITWPGGSFNSGYGVLMFTNSCGGGTLYAYCVDLNHTLQQSPYCVNINPVPVSSTYPEQTPSMAYIQTWYHPTTNYTDDVRQLALWKLSPNNSGIPYYHINAGRGYPNFSSTPVYPFVNTVYSSNTGRNNDANLLVRDALGAADGVQKNVILCGDQINTFVGETVVVDEIATVEITFTLVRGAAALALNNTSVSGVKLLVSTDLGTLSATEVFTDAAGQAVVTISQPVASVDPSHIRVCTYGSWPKSIIPCSIQSQQLLVQQLTTADMCSLCVDVTVTPDYWLSVELLSFGASPSDGLVNLYWSTASESNNDHFELLRDGQIIAMRSGAGTSSSRNDYRHVDDDVTNGRSYRYSLISVDATGARETLAAASATPQAANASVTEFALLQNYPNPFNPTTSITYQLKEAAAVKLTVFDLAGREVATLVNASEAAGSHTVSFDGGNLAAGMYFYRLEAGTFTATRKLMLVK